MDGNLFHELRLQNFDFGVNYFADFDRVLTMYFFNVTDFCFEEAQAFL